MSYSSTLATNADGCLNDFLTLRDGRVWMGTPTTPALDLRALAEQHGTPLEIAFCPQITRRVLEMHAAFAAGRAATGYRGGFLYAYASKANVAAEVVETVLAAGVHCETSSAFDVQLLQRLWATGQLATATGEERFIFCNGSKDQRYLDSIVAMRMAGYGRIVPILDDPHEFESLAACPAPLLLGVRARCAGGGADRFGMTPEELSRLARRIAETPHRLVLYHAMLGSQIEASERLVNGLLAELPGYASLRPFAPHLHIFNFGGGMPTLAYKLGAAFDYGAFAQQLQASVGQWCDQQQLPHPDLAGEFGRYTVADHGAIIFNVGRVKPGQPGQPPWYLVDGSLMVSLPDILIVEGQTFITLALNHLEAPATPAVLGGRYTCDSDDYYPRDGALLLPDAGEGLLVAFFGTGAYQAMLSGEGGAHHCLTPEAHKLVVRNNGGGLSYESIPAQPWAEVVAELGFRNLM
ncbi:MAG: arginine decarboxylase [Chloroflexaceae bacterium]|nr:arginine decarboxylase [Chloroflexaceae bacterium]